MRTRNLLGLSAAFVAAVCLVGSYAMSQDKHAGDKGKPAAGAAAGGMDEAMMKSMMEAGAVGPQHKALEPMAGKFKAVNKFKMDPSQDWTVSEGTYEGEMGLGGRYLLVEVQADMMGMPFQGMGVLGYDNTIKKYVAGWIDNMGTGVMRSEGTSSDGGKTIVFNGEMMCPIEHVMKPYKYQYEVKSSDEFVMRWWSPSMTDKKMFESMVITYTREK
jgi:hypothetical protein